MLGLINAHTSRCVIHFGRAHQGLQHTCLVTLLSMWIPVNSLVKNPYCGLG